MLAVASTGRDFLGLEDALALAEAGKGRRLGELRSRPSIRDASAATSPDADVAMNPSVG